ncbi:formyltetrahydrofolate deformylase [Shimazuella sp. AN120528]|uniref:formyltetrahydrofolate deformylase n=1 Tax=Shimazuella soli TaxID=1892854 RepID=UPI001F0DB2D7|nr:formyltetrahydrofolate deformylase [Shimazuella soli]MCH5585806.1 formyltetrahydrofolate deformylase [Shimazuella soli]
MHTKKVAKKQEDVGRLLISCADQTGIVAAVSQFLFQQGANIIHSDQHATEQENGIFFMRIAFQLDELEEKAAYLQEQFQPIADRFAMEWKISLASHKKKIALFVSKYDHCLQELLWRWRMGELDADIKVVISNHPDCKPLVEPYGLPYYHIPVTREIREGAALEQLEILHREEVDTVILARYMQIIPKSMIDVYSNQIINIHHSFLPAFVGANPYERAFDRGVKLIGATAHYVTEELDEGPIIEQDVQRVSHRQRPEDLIRIGSEVERIVLARAVSWHVNDQVLVHGNKTIVFPG